MICQGSSQSYDADQEERENGRRLLPAPAFDEEIGVLLDKARSGHDKPRRVLRMFKRVPVEPRAVYLLHEGREEVLPFAERPVLRIDVSRRQNRPPGFSTRLIGESAWSWKSTGSTQQRKQATTQSKWSEGIEDMVQTSS